MTNSSPSGAKKYLEAVKAPKEDTMSGEAALTMIINQKFSRNQYLGIRTDSELYNCSLYPSYTKVFEAKSLCHPPQKDMIITEHSAGGKLQG